LNIGSLARIRPSVRHQRGAPLTRLGNVSAGPETIAPIAPSGRKLPRDDMLRIQFTQDDLASTRFLPEPAPMLELKLVAHGLRRGIRASWGARWRHRALAAIPMSARPTVRQIGGHFSWALSPTLAVGADLDEGMETFLGLGRKRLREEMALYFSAPNSGVPLLSRYAFDGDRDAGEALLHGTRAAFTAAVQPYWVDIQANHHSELARHGRLLACRGVGATLTTVIPGARWHGDCMMIDSPQDRTVRLGGRGVLITPTAFWTGPPLVGELPDQPVLLAYPAPAELSIRVGAGSDSLAAILGGTRAAVLRLLATEHTTGDIARQLGISAASASEHSAALRAARLISSRRDGKAVIHRTTVLGLDLVRLNSLGRTMR
jgi:DNA-binding transcriptional ArsR family regulator